jgi:uncharacterized membrane protein
MVSALLLLFVCNVIFIALKAFQQINVVERKWKLVPITSFAMGQAEVWITGTIAAVFITSNSWETKVVAGLLMGIAGSLGATASMWVHNRMEKNDAARKIQGAEAQRQALPIAGPGGVGQ